MAYVESNGHVTDDIMWPERSNSLRAHQNTWGCYLATIANYYIVCCDAVYGRLS